MTPSMCEYRATVMAAAISCGSGSFSQAELTKSATKDDGTDWGESAARPCRVELRAAIALPPAVFRPVLFRLLLRLLRSLRSEAMVSGFRVKAAAPWSPGSPDQPP